jgi:hypothetical protein
VGRPYGIGKVKEEIINLGGYYLDVGIWLLEFHCHHPGDAGKIER